MKSIAHHAILPLALLTALSSIAAAADTYEPECFKPFSPTTKTLHFPAKKPPYRIALANGFIGNTWRIEMIKALSSGEYTTELVCVQSGNEKG